jgi:hypothetical protein
MGISINQSYDDIKRRILESDPTYRVWEFGKPSNFGPDFQSGDFTVSIIDLFGGKIPRLISYETIMGYMPLPLIPTVLLDSNIMALLNDYVLHPQNLSADKTKAITKLMDYFLHTKADYNPTFYSFEAFGKNKGKDISGQFIEFSKTILSLHMMDELHFLKKREIRPDPESFRKYCEKFDTEDLDEMARRDYEYTKQATATQDDLYVFYTLLLKMALIHKTSNKSIVAKMEALYEFTFTNFGLLFGEEMGIAAHYFAGKLDKLIPLQKGAEFENMISRLRSATWDIYLLRFPPLLLGKHEPPLPFCKICTGDKQLAYIGRKFSIYKLFSNKDSFYPALATDYSDLHLKYPEATMQKFYDLHQRFEERRMTRGAKDVVLADDQKINELKLALEEEVRFFCKGGNP